MSAKINNLKEEDRKLTFTLSGIDVSYANAIRRTILSDIPIVVFKTTPYEENKANILINTSRLNNEVVKQRLSCIPICMQINEEFIKDHQLELDVENKTDTIMMVTTKDFKIKNIRTNEYLEDRKLREIFPPFILPDGSKEYFIDFLRLRPKISDEIPGEKIKLTCQFSVGTAKDDSMFNVVGTCSYGYTPDYEKMTQQLEIHKQKWKDAGKNEKEIRFEAENWKLLDGLRNYIKDSFDFVMESVGIYENDQIIIHSCIILLNKLDNLKKVIEEEGIQIKPSDNTLDNCYDITLENEDYTLGNILNYELYKTFYTDLKIINYVGFKKLHPHDNDSLLRVSLVENEKGVSSVKTMLLASIDNALKTIAGIRGCFDGTRDRAR
jgi:DNA-directed RNA polymerase alpha subunit